MYWRVAINDLLPAAGGKLFPSRKSICEISPTSALMKGLISLDTFSFVLETLSILLERAS